MFLNKKNMVCFCFSIEQTNECLLFRCVHTNLVVFNFSLCTNMLYHFAFVGHTWNMFENSLNRKLLSGEWDSKPRTTLDLYAQMNTHSRWISCWFKKMGLNNLKCLLWFSRVLEVFVVPGGWYDKVPLIFIQNGFRGEH